LNRLFHEFFGFSVAALRMEMRLLKAVSLLRDPNIKVINVAEQCGFNHLGLFNTCFKRRFGQTPGQWRKAASPAKVRQTAGIAESAASLLDRGGLSVAKTAKYLGAPLKVNGQILNGTNGSAHPLHQNGLVRDKAIKSDTAKL
jgi:hypothetical protein